MLPITATEAGNGLVPPAVAIQLLGNSGGILILIMLFMAITSTGSAEALAVASLISYDIYRQYFDPEASGERILFVSRASVVVFGLFSGGFAILLQALGVNLGWVYLFMGVMIGSAVFPLWNMMTWKKASGTGAVIAAWSGLVLALIGWLSAAQIQGGTINVDTLGTNEVMLSGNLIAIFSSGIIHYVYSMCFDNQDYNFDELDAHITLVEQDLRGLTDAEKDPVVIAKAEAWITRRGYALTLILIVIWPLLSIPAGVFTKAYFAFWVLVSICWGFAAAIVTFVMPLAESSEDIGKVVNGMYKEAFGKDLFETVEEIGDRMEKEIAAKKADLADSEDSDKGGKAVDSDDMHEA
jgi:urea-proton symporter